MRNQKTQSRGETVTHPRQTDQDEGRGGGGRGGGGGGGDKGRGEMEDGGVLGDMWGLEEELAGSHVTLRHKHQQLVM